MACQKSFGGLYFLFKCTKSSDDLHNNRPHLRAMGPLRFTYVPLAGLPGFARDSCSIIMSICAFHFYIIYFHFFYADHGIPQTFDQHFDHLKPQMPRLLVVVIILAYVHSQINLQTCTTFCANWSTRLVVIPDF